MLYRGKLSCISLIVPHWIPSNLWWALPLLAGLAGTLIWRGTLVAGLASRGRIWSTGLPLLALAVLAAGGAGPARYRDLHKRRPAAGHRSVPAAAGRHPPLHQSGQKQPAFPHPVSLFSRMVSRAKRAPGRPVRSRFGGRCGNLCDLHFRACKCAPAPSPLSAHCARRRVSQVRLPGRRSSAVGGSFIIFDSKGRPCFLHGRPFAQGAAPAQGVRAHTLFRGGRRRPAGVPIRRGGSCLLFPAPFTLPPGRL